MPQVNKQLQRAQFPPMKKFEGGYNYACGHFTRTYEFVQTVNKDEDCNLCRKVKEVFQKNGLRHVAGWPTKGAGFHPVVKEIVDATLGGSIW